MAASNPRLASVRLGEDAGIGGMGGAEGSDMLLLDLWAEEAEVDLGDVRAALSEGIDFAWSEEAGAVRRFVEVEVEVEPGLLRDGGCMSVVVTEPDDAEIMDAGAVG